jgi:hypothetical protein
MLSLSKSFSVSVFDLHVLVFSGRPIRMKWRQATWFLSKKLLGWLLQIFDTVMKKGRSIVKIVAIGNASSFHLHHPNGHNSINEKGNYHQLLAELRREQSCFDCYDSSGPRRQTDKRSRRAVSFIIQKSQSARFVVAP